MYAATQDMIDRFGRVELIRLLTRPDEDQPDTVDEVRLGIVLAEVSDLIDSYLCGRYRVPLAPVPRSIMRACVMLARYDLMFSEASAPTESAKAIRDQIIAWLTDIRDGKIDLDLPSAGGDDSTDSDVLISDRPRLAQSHGGAIW